jgi:exodeoxyribonuclease VII large subunit
MALQTSPDEPLPVRVVSQHIGAWVHRLGAVWVEGQVAELSRRPGSRTAFVVLRDPAAHVSLRVTCPVDVLDRAATPLAEGARVVVHGAPSWWFERGSLSLAVDDVRPVGIGALLARIEQVRRLLAAEGLFDAARKRPLPFVPRQVGLVVGRASAAEHDVVRNARLRAPGIPFRIENVPVQGPSAVPEIVGALQRLEADPAVDVIILARGGGSVEDLLPFSDEHLVRAVAACRTPVVAAIGHETDTPLVDLVADLRASTPTDAAKRVVPDVAEERQRVDDARARMRDRARGLVVGERARLEALLSRPALADPAPALVASRRDQVSRQRQAALTALQHRLAERSLDVARLLAQVEALSPAATLARGYAVVQRVDDGSVLRDAAQVRAGDALRLRLAHGEVGAVVSDA